MKLALSTNGAAATRETFIAFRDAGIPAMEISNGQRSAADTIDFPKLKALADEYGIALWSYHLPFAPFKELDPSVPALAEETVAYFCSMIDKAAAVGIKVYVVHPSGEPIAEEDRPARIACAQKSLAALAEYAKTKGGVIAVEDLPRTCLGRSSSDILALVSAHPDLRVCFDTNHLLSEPIADFIRACGSKFITTTFPTTTSSTSAIGCRVKARSTGRSCTTRCLRSDTTDISSTSWVFTVRTGRSTASAS